MKNWCFCIVVLEKNFENSLDSEEIKPVNSKGNQPWIFIGGTDTEAAILWPPNAKSQLLGKDPDAGGEWGQKEKRAEEEMVRQHQWLKPWEIVKDRGAWFDAVYGVTKSKTSQQLTNS